MKEQSAFDPQAKGRECRLLQGLLVAALVLLVPLQGFPQGGVGNPVTKEAIARRYGNAPEKRRAAEFLLDNMARHTSVYSPALATYYDRLADIFAHDGRGQGTSASTTSASTCCLTVSATRTSARGARRRARPGTPASTGWRVRTTRLAPPTGPPFT